MKEEIFDNQQKTCLFNNLKEINRPITLELIYPGSIFSDMATTISIIYNTNPQFLWYSDYCNECNYAIRCSCGVCACDKLGNEHMKKQKEHY